MPRRNQHTTQDANQTLPSSRYPQSPLDSAIPAISTAQVPYRQIRALYDDETINRLPGLSGVYCHPRRQYAEALGVEGLCDGEDDVNKAYHISAADLHRHITGNCPATPSKIPGNHTSSRSKFPHKRFAHLPSVAAVTGCHGRPLTAEQRSKPIRVQWDPERGPNLEALPYRSIQLGIGGRDDELKRQWTEEWIVGIEDVTELLEAVTEKEGESRRLSDEEAVKRGLMPEERVCEVDDEVRKILQMEEGGKEWEQKAKIAKFRHGHSPDVT